MNIVPIRQVGLSYSASLKTDYQTLVDKLGMPNVTDLDDPSKVPASWGFMDADTGRRAFVWCYKREASVCRSWSVSGDLSLIAELFPGSSILL
jgi:hypothetical protein